MWWHAVIMETVDGNPWFGLGFGTDLASRFVSEYYPEQGEDFDVRSPHNVMLTLFGRAGAAGTIPLLIITGLIALNIIRSARRRDPALGAWCAAWIILISACFGVVLEGPMGAVVFWSLLGIAAAESRQTPRSDEIDLTEPESLPNPDASA
uniref:O-antigen ligase family protein n=2 Tax=Cephaloticoccus sp. TaxID=1985742 RepID=UPI00404B6E1E